MEQEVKYGPQIEVCDDKHAEKYRLPNETFEESVERGAAAMQDNDDHRRAYKDVLMHQRFLPAGRVQAAMGSPRAVTAYNCFVSGGIEDSMDSIMQRAAEAAETMRRGGGIGFDFSSIRPSGDRIVSLDSSASGPVSFMHIFDAVCRTIVSAGHRRGAMMAVLRVDHPNIEEFIRAKKNDKDLTNFNISVGVTDEFMECVTKVKASTLSLKVGSTIPLMPVVYGMRSCVTTGTGLNRECCSLTVSTMTITSITLRLSRLRTHAVSNPFHPLVLVS